MNRPLSTPLVRLEIAEIATLQIDNPPLNLVTREILHGLLEATHILGSVPEVRCLIVHGGTSRAFCAGSDMREFKTVQQRALVEKILPEEFSLRALANLPFPTIAALNGAALGGGLELALACDLRVAATHAVVGLPESLIGGLGGTGAVRLARLVGPAKAKDLLFTGRAVPAAEALTMGIVDRVGHDARALADEIAAQVLQGGPLSHLHAKKLVDQSLDGSLDEALARTHVAQQAIFQTEDLLAGAAAFLTKQTPKFTGR